MLFLKEKRESLKKIHLLFHIAFFIIFLAKINYAQLSRDAWAIGFGFYGPKISVTPSGLGGYGSIQRNFSEHVGIRVLTAFGDFKEEWSGVNEEAQITSTESFQVNLDMLYYLSPCEWFSPFVYGGLGFNSFTVDNPEDIDINNEVKNTGQVGLGLGTEVDLGKNWKIKADVGFYSLMRDDFDGRYGPEGGGVFGTNNDSFMKLEIGALWYFSKGEKSKICQIYTGIEQEDNFDYDQFERTLEENLPKEIVAEKIVVKTASQKEKRMLLLGVNFEFNSSKLTAESYPVLYHASQVFRENPNVKIVVEGHCDSIGTDEVNQRISLQRADAVKNYLVEHGINEEQIKTIGYGATKTIADNGTETGRALNRRIEFRVID